MEALSKDFVEILEYLLSGFVVAWIFYSLTSYSKPSQFERIVQALIFTLFVQITISVLKEIFPEGEFVSIWPVGIAILYGLAFAGLANNDLLHKILRLCRITSETSFPSEWFGAFRNVGNIVLHLKDERRLYGWAKEWPSSPDKGHFLIVRPAWVVNGQEELITGVKYILISATDVKWVEFIEQIESDI